MVTFSNQAISKGCIVSIRVLPEPLKKKLLSLQTARIAIVLSDIPADLANKIGFTNITEGQSILPAIIGRVSEFNANGKEIARKDLPKIKKDFHMNASHRDWGGNIHTSVQTRSMMVYPKDLVLPPGEYITIANGPNGLIITSREFSYNNLASNENESSIIHLINLFLELFGKFDVVGKDLVAPSATVVKVNWKVLPAGIYPFKRVMAELKELINGLGENTRPVVEHRLKSISKYNPDFMAVGSGGFSDYVILGFTEKNLYILESPKLGNATYAFLNEWEKFSQLTKRDILTGQHQHARLIHNKKWLTSLSQLIASP